MRTRRKATTGRGGSSTTAPSVGARERGGGERARTRERTQTRRGTQRAHVESESVCGGVLLELEQDRFELDAQLRRAAVRAEYVRSGRLEVALRVDILLLLLRFIAAVAAAADRAAQPRHVPQGGHYRW